jgi:hypothetical protein
MVGGTAQVRGLIQIHMSNSQAEIPRFVSVMAGLDPAIHPSSRMLSRSLMDARVKPGHDERICIDLRQASIFPRRTSRPSDASS